MDKKTMIEKIKSRAKDGKLSCEQAQRLAEEEDITYGEMGDLLNEIEIKVVTCQLGCFP